MSFMDRIRSALSRETAVDEAAHAGDDLTIAAGALSYSQLDITEGFGDDARLGPDEWISTIPLNASTPDPEAVGLPAVGSTDEAVYEVASTLSEIRESVAIPTDGVYCPVCHLANVDAGKLRHPCPRCGRPLLTFGWD